MDRSLQFVLVDMLNHPIVQIGSYLRRGEK